MKKFTLCLAAAAILAAVLCSCGSTGGRESESLSDVENVSPSDSYTLVYRTSGSGEQATGGAEFVPPADEEIPAIKPTEAVKPEDVRPEDNFLGSYVSGGYTAKVEASDGERVRITVVSDKDFEWTFTGFFSETTRTINYSDAVKTEITRDRDGAEKTRETVYENGSGRIEFTGSGFVWRNSMEPLDGSVEFTKS